MNKAVFLDRDGVINDPRGLYYVSRREDFHINEGVFEALKDLQQADYLLFVVTNQGGVSKGEYSMEDVDALHAFFEEELALHEVQISEILVCPHHDTIENCLCRKPKSLMIEKALSAYAIDPRQSWLIGDKKSDIAAGKKAGLNTILAPYNGDLRHVIKEIS